MVRKVTDEVAKAKQEEMARATIRKINRRLFGMTNAHPLYHFLLGCRNDVAQSQAVNQAA